VQALLDAGGVQAGCADKFCEKIVAAIRSHKLVTHKYRVFIMKRLDMCGNYWIIFIKNKKLMNRKAGGIKKKVLFE
jgi:hypothetical protein